MVQARENRAQREKKSKGERTNERATTTEPKEFMSEGGRGEKRRNAGVEKKKVVGRGEGGLRGAKEKRNERRLGEEVSKKQRWENGRGETMQRMMGVRRERRDSKSKRRRCIRNEDEQREGGHENDAKKKKRDRERKKRPKLKKRRVNKVNEEEEDQLKWRP